MQIEDESDKNIQRKNSVDEELALDEDWKKQQIEKLAENIMEEAKLKQLVIQKEAQFLEKQKILGALKSEYFDFFSRLIEESNSITLNVTDYELFCVEALEKRIDYLNERADKLQSDLTEFSQKVSEENQDAHAHDDLNLNLQKQLNETLYENKTLEKYIRSENFRIYDETIGSLKYNLEELLVKKKELKEIRVSLSKSESKKKEFLEKLQRMYRKLNSE